MKYGNFAAALKAHGTPAQIVKKFGFNRRQVFEYLAGRALPRAEKIVAHPDLIDAIRHDVIGKKPAQLVAA
jgi:hypothetical protein